MDLIQLKYFQTVAKNEHMTKASKELNIAQPALSKSISLLEQDLGVKLFDRNGKKIKLNFYGEILLKRVNSILTLLENSIKEVQDLSNNEFAQVKLLVLAGSTLIPDLLGQFRKIYPNVSFKFMQHQNKNKSNYNFDLCITSSLFESKSINYMTLLREEVFLGVSYEHPLSSLDSIYLSNLEDEDFIVLDKSENFREITDTFCKSSGFEPNIAFECDTPSMVHSLIKGGHGVGFISGKSWGMNYDSSIKLLHIEDITCERFIELYWPNDKYMSHSTKLFISFIKEYFNKFNL